MRLFLGSYAQIDHYDTIREHFGPKFDGKWVVPENLHMTWLFLGERDDVDAIIEALAPLRDMPKPRLTLKGFGTCGHPDPKVLYLRARTTDALPLHNAIVDLLHHEEKRPFRAHVTLARIKTPHVRDLLHADTPWMHTVVGEVAPALHLFESRLGPGGPKYRPIEAFQ
jgi:2'-5' RNA ligase